LIGVEASSQLVLLDERAARLEPANDLVACGQIIDFVSACRMSLDRKNLAVHPEAADAVVCAELEGGKKGVGVLHAETAQLCEGVRPVHLADGSSRRRDELNGFFTECQRALKSRQSEALEKPPF
jgi:hypothetical protein